MIYISDSSRYRHVVRATKLQLIVVGHQLLKEFIGK